AQVVARGRDGATVLQELPGTVAGAAPHVEVGPAVFVDIEGGGGERVGLGAARREGRQRNRAERAATLVQEDDPAGALRDGDVDATVAVEVGRRTAALLGRGDGGDRQVLLG